VKLSLLTPEAFDRLTHGRRFRARTREMLREVLVEGRSHREVGKRYGVSAQRVSAAVRALEDSFQTTQPGMSWVKMRLELPELLALEMAGLSDALKGCPDPERRGQATRAVANSARQAAESLSDPAP